MPNDQQLEKAMSRLQKAVESLEKSGTGSGASEGGDRRKEIADIQAMIGEAIQLLDAKSGGSGA